MQQKKIAIVLFGSGVFDGTEITEAVSCILASEKAGVEISFFAPDILQADVIDHASGKTLSQSRNVLSESARIARGTISDLKNLKLDDFDALLFPGGFGAAKNASDFAFCGESAKILPELSDLLDTAFKQKKPMGFACISPASIAAIALGKYGVNLTIGSDKQTAKALESFGAKHVECSAEDFVKDPNYPIYSTPAYMLATKATQVFEGICKMVESMLK